VRQQRWHFAPLKSFLVRARYSPTSCSKIYWTNLNQRGALLAKPTTSSQRTGYGLMGS
jgi:hypothetical protein